MAVCLLERTKSSAPASVRERVNTLILHPKVAPAEPLPKEELARAFGMTSAETYRTNKGGSHHVQR
jgi:hypothetical protein